MSGKSGAFALVLCVFACVFACFADIPSYIHVCHRKDPQLKQCVVSSIEAIKPKLKEGIPELNVPPVEPLLLDKIQLRSGPNQAQINANFSNLQVWGFPTSSEIKEFYASIPDKRFTALVHLPEVYFKGDYYMDVNVLVLKYKGQGIITGNLTDYVLDVILDYNLIKKAGKDYINFPKIGIKLTTGKSLIQLEELGDNTNSALEQGMREVLRDNTELFIEEIQPALEEGLSVRLTEIANQIAHSFPYDELFPL